MQQQEDHKHFTVDVRDVDIERRYEILGMKYGYCEKYAFVFLTDINACNCFLRRKYRHTCHDVTENFLSEHDFIEFPTAGIVIE